MDNYLFPSMFGIQDWHSGEITTDNEKLNAGIEAIKEICKGMNAAQTKAYVLALSLEIDKRAKI